MILTTTSINLDAKLTAIFQNVTTISRMSHLQAKITLTTQLLTRSLIRRDSQPCWSKTLFRWRDVIRRTRMMEAFFHPYVPIWTKAYWRDRSQSIQQSTRIILALSWALFQGKLVKRSLQSLQILPKIIGTFTKKRNSNISWTIFLPLKITLLRQFIVLQIVRELVPVKLDLLLALQTKNTTDGFSQ